MPRRVVEDGGFRPVEWRWTDLPQVRWKLKVLKVLSSGKFRNRKLKNEKSPVEWRWTDFSTVKISNDCIFKLENYDGLIVNLWNPLRGEQHVTHLLPHSLTHTQTEKACFKRNLSFFRHSFRSDNDINVCAHWKGSHPRKKYIFLPKMGGGCPNWL